MKKIIKYMIFILGVFLLNITSINAEEYNGAIEKGERIDGIYYYKTREDSETIKYPTHNFHEEAHIYYDSISHNVVYCIESWKPMTGAVVGDYEVFDHNVPETKLTDDQLKEINLIAYYGYGYKDEQYDHTSPEWYAITQILIWEIQAPNYSHYIVDSISSTKALSYYNFEISKFKTMLTFKKNELCLYNHTMNINTKWEDLDITGNLRYYQVDEYDDGIDVSIDGSNVVIKSLNKAGNFSYTLRRKFNKWNKKMKLYISDNYQNVFEPGDPDDDVYTRTITVNDFNLDFIVYALVPLEYTEEQHSIYRSYFLKMLM